MISEFKTVDYEAALDQAIRLWESLPASHPARFTLDMVAELDFALICGRCGSSGGETYAPEVLVALLFYGYATGVFSSRIIGSGWFDCAR